MPRIKLPNRRPGLSTSFILRGMRYHGTVSINEDGEWKEIFLTAGKTGTDVHTVSRDLGIVASLLLQYGCPLETILAALTQERDGVPAGPLGVLLQKLINKD